MVSAIYCPRKLGRWRLDQKQNVNRLRPVTVVTDKAKSHNVQGETFRDRKAVESAPQVNERGTSMRIISTACGWDFLRSYSHCCYCNMIQIFHMRICPKWPLRNILSGFCLFSHPVSDRSPTCDRLVTRLHLRYEIQIWGVTQIWVICNWASISNWVYAGHSERVCTYIYIPAQWSGITRNHPSYDRTGPCAHSNYSTFTVSIAL